MGKGTRQVGFHLTHSPHILYLRPTSYLIPSKVPPRIPSYRVQNTGRSGECGPSRSAWKEYFLPPTEKYPQGISMVRAVVGRMQFAKGSRRHLASYYLTSRSTPYYYCPAQPPLRGSSTAQPGTLLFGTSVRTSLLPSYRRRRTYPLIPRSNWVHVQNTFYLSNFQFFIYY